MNGLELLERRAERGTARGAANVWANAQLSASPDPGRAPDKRSHVLFRAALVIWILGLIVVTIDQANDDAQTDTAFQPNSTEPLSADDEAILPAPILVEGMQLNHVALPADPNFAGDNDLLDRLFPTNRELPIINDLDERGTSTVIFADPERPFEEPIIGLLLFGTGGFRPWGVNVEPGQLEELASKVAQQDGDWTIADDTGLVEVARFDDDPWDMIRFGWQFDFVDGDDHATLQAERHDVATEWIWISRLAAGEVDNGQGLFLSPTTVLGNDASVLSMARANGSSVGQDDARAEIIWTSNDFVYRLTSATVRDNTAFGRSSDSDIQRLEVVERQAWLDAVDQANSTPAIEWVAGLLSILLLLALIVSSVVLLFRRSYRSAAISFSTVIVWIVMLGSLGFPRLLILITGLGLAWWSWHNSRRKSSWGLDVWCWLSR